MTYYIRKTDKPKKKYMLVMPYNKKVYFGASGYRDITLMNKKTSKFYEPDKEERNKVKKNYLKRHSREPKIFNSPSVLSDIILWNKPTLKESIIDYGKKYNIVIK